jgi:feruloyl-CoA synthase
MTHPVRQADIAMLEAGFEERPDGSILLRPLATLGDYPDRFTAHLTRWAAVAPDRTFIARRGADGAWRRVSYAQALAAARSIGQALLDLGLSAERPVLVLSGNDIEHALLGLACLHVGVPYSPVSTAYSLVSQDFAKLRQIAGVLTPGLVFAADGARYGRAIRAVLPEDATLVVTEAPPEGLAARRFAELLATVPGPAVEAAHAAIGPDTLAKLLFTSGSTGVPKGVINTHRMLASNQRILQQTFPLLTRTPPVIVDWLPWNHTFGGNHNVGLVLANGGTLYIDDGRPVPGGFAETVRNLREIAPTVYFNVPKGFEELVAYLRREPALRETFFSQVAMLFFAGAGLAQHVFDAMDELAVQTIGRRVQWMTGLGSTETGPFALCCRPDATASGHVGLPAPGVELKLVSVAGKLEARVRSPSITPGYWRNPAQTATLHDEDGFLCMGDALDWIDPARRHLGLRFDGRISEDFKLATGTWVSVGPLRAKLVQHLAPEVRDVVVAGINRDYVAVLAIPERPDLAEDGAVRARLAARLAELAAAATGSSMRVMRLGFLTAPLSVDAGEVTDKGSLNQRGVLARHAALVERLYAEPPAEDIICVRELVA